MSNNLIYIKNWQRKYPEKNKEYQARWRLRHPDKNHKFHQEYRDKNKGKIQTYRRNNLHLFRGYTKANQHRARKLVLEHYGGKPPKCVNCGCSIFDCLDIDHIYNNGSKERKKQGTGTSFVKWLISNNFPSGYQILCRNCNWLKYIKLLRK